jgi:hypothetical protein
VDISDPGQIRSKKLPDLTSLIIISENQLPWVYWISLNMISPPGMFSQNFIVACATHYNEFTYPHYWKSNKLS